MSLARERFRAHRSHAKARGIAFLLTFEEWWAIWLNSGRWDQRGQRADQYCMARHNDKGPYAVGNVSIITNHENNKASQKWDDARHRHQSQIMRGNKHNLGHRHSEASIELMRAKQLGKRHSDATKASMRAAWQRRKQRDANVPR